MSRPAAESVFGVYFDQLVHLGVSDKNPKEVAVAIFRRFASAHSRPILDILVEMDRLYREMRSVLDEFTGRSYVLVTILTAEHLATAMKLYVISWYTMLDLVARAVNAAFDLGIADGDVRLRLVLSNAHVKSSRIPAILQSYEKALCIKDLKKRRHDAVHRGWIPDSDVDAMLKERNRIDSSRYSLLEANPISDEEYNERVSGHQKRLRALAESKRELWGQLHEQTVAMASEVARELAGKVLERYRKEAI